MSLDQLAIVGLAVAVTADAFGNLMPNMASVYAAPCSNTEYNRGVRLTMLTAGGVGLAVGAIISGMTHSGHAFGLSLLIAGLFAGAYEYAIRHDGSGS